VTETTADRAPAIAGRVFRYGDAVSTDALFPGRYTYTHTTPAEIASHALEDLDPQFARSVRPGDVVVGGRAFGCGSSREQAVTCLVALGVGAVVAKSISRIYFRNAVNAGLPAIACPRAVDALQAGDRVVVDLDGAWIDTPAGRFSFPPLAPNVRLLLRCGGLGPYVRERLRLAGGGEA
jgi:3-isopropylmalate/(R)-2-methylmalate dehydratase small subunit